MSAELYTELGWLRRAPGDYRNRCAAVVQNAQSTGDDVRQLANYALDEVQLTRLAGVIEKLKKSGKSLSPLTPFKLGIVGNSTLNPIVTALTATAARYGIDLECVKANYGQTIQEALDENSTINQAKPDAVLIALDYRGLPLGAVTMDNADTQVAASLDLVATLRSGFRRNCGALSIVQTLAPPPEALFGSIDRVVAGTLRRATAEFNAGLAESVASSEDVMLDIGALAETVGLANWYSPTQWHVAKLSFDSSLLGIYADHTCRLIAALRGKSRKVLVLDLDNTLWGGVIGDDGLEGIVLGQGDATGEAYLELQRLALALRSRGIVLAVSSKNTDEIARAAFQRHPEMLLRENHIAVFQANWNDKATNIKAIASELSLGIDSVVFVDDNPAERALVRDTLPTVAVPEMPENPALYARTLAAAGYFEGVAFSDEDKKRADFYQDNARRVALASQAADMDSYLESLDMTISFLPFDAAGRSRIAQLINKSNQFNLTTRRYTEADVAAFEADPKVFSLQVRLADAFGDNGMIGVVICREKPDNVWEIDTWLMSCRVLGRRVENMVLGEILQHARARGITRLVGVYLPTEKNGLVREHYQKLGFAPAGSEQDGTTYWETTPDLQVLTAPMKIVRGDFSPTVAVAS